MQAEVASAGGIGYPGGMQAEPENGGLRLHAEPVRPEWIDYNGHMNVAYYVLAFDHATDAFLDHIGLGRSYAAVESRSVFVVEAHVNYLREVTEGDGLAFETRVLGFDAKRIHLFHSMRHEAEGWLAATNELMLLHVDLADRRSARMPDGPLGALERIFRQQAGLPRPELAGRSVGMSRPAA